MGHLILLIYQNQTDAKLPLLASRIPKTLDGLQIHWHETGETFVAWHTLHMLSLPKAG